MKGNKEETKEEMKDISIISKTPINFHGLPRLEIYIFFF